MYDLPSIEPDGVQHAIQQLPGSPHEWPANSIFVPSRGLADEHDRGARDAIREHELGCGPLQRAAVEIRHKRPQRFQIGRRRGQGASRNLGSFGRPSRSGALTGARSRLGCRSRRRTHGGGRICSEARLLSRVIRKAVLRRLA